MKEKVIFGYGSLIDEDSMRATSPNATNFRPAYIKGFRRDFSLWDPVGYTETNLDVAGVPFCGLDTYPVTDSEAHVNGVVFTVSGKDLSQMYIREREYKLIKTPACDYYTDKSLGYCEVFSSGIKNSTFDFNSAPQLRYLDIFLRASKRFGEEYFQEVLRTTFIEDKSLEKCTHLKAYLEKLSK